MGAQGRQLRKMESRERLSREVLSVKKHDGIGGRTPRRVQLHVEFAEPVPPKGESQGRGNSGVFLMGLYEIQVLDSYENKTYADGQAAAVYGQYPPLVNASR